MDHPPSCPRDEGHAGGGQPGARGDRQRAGARAALRPHLWLGARGITPSWGLTPAGEGVLADALAIP